MADQKLIDEVGRYIDKYYKPENDDIKLDHEILSVFDKISEFRKKRAEKKNLKEDSDQEYDESTGHSKRLDIYMKKLQHHITGIKESDQQNE